MYANKLNVCGVERKKFNMDESGEGEKNEYKTKNIIFQHQELG